jgi:hypothetical protein
MNFEDLIGDDINRVEPQDTKIEVATSDVNEGDGMNLYAMELNHHSIGGELRTG